MQICIHGIGYVGLAQAAVFAEAGHDVLCVDTDEAKIEALKVGIVPIHEPGLDSIVREGLRQGRLRFTVDPAEGVGFARVQMIAVGTPSDEGGSPDLGQVLAVAAAIGTNMRDERTVVVKSTVSVGSADRVADEIGRRLAARGRSDLSFSVASNPEFLREGSAIADCGRPDRIIVGVEDPHSEAILRDLYAPFNRHHEKFIVMDRRSAELTKYAANAMLATRISLMNEIACVSAQVGADISAVRKGIGSDPRIGYDFIYAGIGYGGSCLPKDVRALSRLARDVGCEPVVLEAVEKRNARAKNELLAMVRRRLGPLGGLRFALWGLAFKADTDDMRMASSRVLMEGLWDAGAVVRAYDPVAMETCRTLYGDRNDLILCRTKEEALEGADALLIATEWKGFRVPSFQAIRASLRHNVVFDGRNLYEPDEVAAHGLDYFSIGRPARLAGVRLAVADEPGLTAA